MRLVLKSQASLNTGCSKSHSSDTRFMQHEGLCTCAQYTCVLSYFLGPELGTIYIIVFCCFYYPYFIEEESKALKG